MRVEFSIQARSAVAGGLRDPSQWLTWAAAPTLPTGEPELDLSHVPAMARRRLGRLAKMAVVVADDVLHQAQAGDMPIVWASRYGDATKSLALLRAQVAGEALSPTAFGLSVHNGVGAQHSILRGITSNAICVSSSGSAPEAGVVEALGLLHEGAEAVLLVCYDEPLPGEYAAFGELPAADFAWAALLAAPSSGQACFALTATADEGGDKDASELPHGLRALQFLLDEGQSRWSHRRPEGGSWVWERVHA